VHTIVFGQRFERSFRHLARRNPAMKARVEQTLRRMAHNLNDPTLKTHHLSGKLDGLLACSCGYDCRIVFSIEKKQGTKEQVLLLVDIGSHDEVY
jgi:mRNA interferase YafQ